MISNVSTPFPCCSPFAPLLVVCSTFEPLPQWCLASLTLDWSGLSALLSPPFPSPRVCVLLLFSLLSQFLDFFCCGWLFWPQTGQDCQASPLNTQQLSNRWGLKTACVRFFWPQTGQDLRRLHTYCNTHSEVETAILAADWPGVWLLPQSWWHYLLDSKLHNHGLRQILRYSSASFSMPWNIIKMSLRNMG